MRFILEREAVREGQVGSTQDEVVPIPVSARHVPPGEYSPDGPISAFSGSGHFVDLNSKQLNNSDGCNVGAQTPPAGMGRGRRFPARSGSGGPR
jgi:hypothetical protein